MKTPAEWAALFYSNKIMYIEDLIKQVQDEAITESIDAILQSVTELKQKHGAQTTIKN